MARGTLYLPALIAGAVLMACVAAVLAVSEKAEATFPGKNGRIAYDRGGAPDSIEIYTINAGGGGRVQLTHNTTEDGEASYSPRSKRIAYSGFDGKDWRSTLSKPLEEVGSNSPTTLRTMARLPTRPAARR